MIDLPVLPDPYFWRIGVRHFLGTDMIQVQIRRRWRLGPLRWSTREDVGMSTQEILGFNNDTLVVQELCRQLSKTLHARLRPVNLGVLQGDH